MSTLRAVIFDYSTLTERRTDYRNEMRRLLITLRAHGIKIAVFSTNPVDMQAVLSEQSFPGIDLLLTKEDVGKNKGAKEWITLASSYLGVPPHQMLYVGDCERGSFHLDSPTWEFLRVWLPGLSP